jgi:hypothetical protein
MLIQIALKIPKRQLVPRLKPTIPLRVFLDRVVGEVRDSVMDIVVAELVAGGPDVAVFVDVDF